MLCVNTEFTYVFGPATSLFLIPVSNGMHQWVLFPPNTPSSPLLCSFVLSLNLRPKSDSWSPLWLFVEPCTVTQAETGSYVFSAPAAPFNTAGLSLMNEGLGPPALVVSCSQVPPLSLSLSPLLPSALMCILAVGMLHMALVLLAEQSRLDQMAARGPQGCSEIQHQPVCPFLGGTAGREGGLGETVNLRSSMSRSLMNDTSLLGADRAHQQADGVDDVDDDDDDDDICCRQTRP